MRPEQVGRDWLASLRQKDPKPFLKASLLDPWFLILTVSLLLFTNWIGHRWIFERATLQGTDVFESVRPHKEAKFCSLITIDEKDYGNYLGDCLAPARLDKVIREILKYQPRVMAIDIDTSAPRFKDLRVQSGETKLVWARSAAPVMARTIAGGSQRRSYDWEVRDVLGNQIPAPNYAGVSLFALYPDWNIRGFGQEISLESQHVKAPSFHAEIVRAYCDSKPAPAACNGPRKTEEQEITSDWDIRMVSLGDLMGSGGDIKPAPSTLTEIVILGGSSEDIHETPFGSKMGSELVAAAVETELSGAVAPPNLSHSKLKWVIKGLLALAISWMISQWKPLWATSGMLVLLMIVFMASFFGVYYGLFQLDFLPFMIGMWIEQLIDSSAHAHRHTEN